MKTWILADPHFGQKSILTFKRNNGELLRSFCCIANHDMTIIENCNRLISDSDKVYVLGDVCMDRKHLYKIGLIKGRKTLIAGNHDQAETKEYLKYFKNVRAYKMMPKLGFILSHIPVHPNNLYRFTHNIHGHVHEKSYDDERYINVCVEVTDYKPVDLQEIIERTK